MACDSWMSSHISCMCAIDEWVVSGSLLGSLANTTVHVESLQKFVLFVLVIALTSWPTTAVGQEADFNNCLTNVKKGTYGIGVDIGGTDNHGNPVNVSAATAITYGLCISACGSGQEPFDWIVFSHQFSAWLLPWLALVSQLPFGANDKLDNIISVLLTVGSPTLAAYSLVLTVLNGRWIAQRFAGHTYPNVRNAIRTLSGLQQLPLEIETKGGLLASLIVLPENDKWWGELIESIDYTHTWSVSAVTSIGWVVIAYIFTLVDSFIAGGMTNFTNNGQGVGSLWLWLLPIVIGWLKISPKCDSKRLSRAVDRANKIAHFATDEGDVVLVKHAKTEARAIKLTIQEVDYLRWDEKCTAPIYNYARFFPWVQAVETVSAVFEAASERYQNHQSVNPFKEWVTVEGDGPHASNRVGNATQVEEYCVSQHFRGRRSHWGPKVLSRMFIASVFALMLQWGTTGAAIIDVWFTPTKGEQSTAILLLFLFTLITLTGLGCRSASYLLYAVLSTIVWMLLVTSSILTHYITPPGPYVRRPIIHRWSTRAAEHLSIIFRRLGKAIATFNSIWVVLTCIFQFGQFFNRCYCNSSVFWLRDHAYNVILLVPDDMPGIRSAWIGGVCLAIGSAVLFVLFISVYIHSPLPES